MRSPLVIESYRWSCVPLREGSSCHQGVSVSDLEFLLGDPMNVFETIDIAPTLAITMPGGSELLLI